MTLFEASIDIREVASLCLGVSVRSTCTHHHTSTGSVPAR